MAHEWNIRPRGHACQHCQAPFQEGELCISALLETTDEKGARAFERDDGCRACGPCASDAVLSVWQNVYRAPEPPPADPAPRQTVESLLRQLMEGDTTEAHQPAIFILALMLERKKLLIERSTRRQPDGALMRVYEHRKTGEVLLVVDPELRPESLEPVQAQITALLTPPASGPAQDAGEDQSAARVGAPGAR